jgi:hypothetical protein
MNTAQKNIAIEFFMGNKYNILGNDPELHEWTSMKMLNYHFNWHGLMPVLMEVNKFRTENFYVETMILNNSFSIMVRHNQTGVVVFDWLSCIKSEFKEIDSPMAAIHEGIYQFIIWKNKEGL